MTKAKLKARFIKEHPGKFFLDSDQLEALEVYLKSCSWLSQNQFIESVEKPGEGNMNYVLRVILQTRNSFIIKQSRSWVEKYPQIDAPISRILVEQAYYAAIENDPNLSSYSPRLIGFDQENYIMAMEDLGTTQDHSIAYQKDQSISMSMISEAVNYLNYLQNVEVEGIYPLNMEMRRLNHQHIFYLPFLENNGFDLDQIQPGLQAVALEYQKDGQLRIKVEQLGETYLAQGTVLLHGDYYPGSLLDAQGKLKVIDPEFSFVGPVEWDIAIFIAHLYLTQAHQEVIDLAYSSYKKQATFDEHRFWGFVGTEILRRLIGLAQLPLEMSLEEKSELMSRAKDWIMI